MINITELKAEKEIIKQWLEEITNNVQPVITENVLKQRIKVLDELFPNGEFKHIRDGYQVSIEKNDKLTDKLTEKLKNINETLEVFRDEDDNNDNDNTVQEWFGE